MGYRPEQKEMIKSRHVRVLTTQIIELQQQIGHKIQTLTGIMPSDRELVYIALKQYIEGDEINIEKIDNQLIIN